MSFQSLQTFAGKFFNSPPVVSIALFLLAFIPRLIDLGRFLTADEFLWVDRSRNFLAGLTNPAFQCATDVEKWEFATGLACTLRTGHPGVTTMWTGSFGLVLSWLANGRYLSLHNYVVGLSTNPLDASLIAPARFGTVVITSVWVVVVYWLVRRLLGGRIALVSVLFLALNPFHVALSRVIHHDALSTTFMTLSVLAAFIYWGQGTSKKWLLASGVLAGFGVLSKSPALYLMPFIALVGLWFAVKDVRHQPDDPAGKSAPRFQSLLFSTLLKRTIPDGLLWFAMLVLTLFIFWPAMWVVPIEAISTVIFVGSKYATGGHAKGNFFLGEISNDPGPLFYPVTWLFRTSPLIMLGIVSALVAWIAGLFNKKGTKRSRFRMSRSAQQTGESHLFFSYLPLILLFILGYYLLMTIGEKKQERYFLPVYPWLNIIAAGGLVIFIDYFVAFIKVPAKHRLARFAPLPAAVLVINGYFVLSHVPYYFTYYNPLMGGVQAAEKNITVGWGEGLDLAAGYLNAQPNPTQTRISSWYESTFAPYYYGPSISYSKEKGKALAGDFVVFYINQIQRRYPDDILFEYFIKRTPPREVISMNEVNYVWIYPGLGVDHYVEDQTYTGIASLLAWQWGTGDTPLLPGESVPFELFWEYLGKQPDEPFFLRLIDAQGRIWSEGQTRLVEGGGGNPPINEWRQGEILYDRGALYLPSGIPPGQYQLQIGLYTSAPAVTDGELLFELHSGDEFVTLGSRPFPYYILPDIATQKLEPLGNSLNLVGVASPQKPVAAGSQIPVELFWRIEQPLPADATVHVGLMDLAGEARQAWFNLSLAETFTPAETTWQPGDIIRTQWQLELLPTVPPGKYQVELVLPDDTSQILPIANVVVE